MRINRLAYFLILSGILIAVQSCTSVPYVKKHQLQAGIKNMTVSTFVFESSKDSSLLKKQYLEFTKQGRVNYSVTLNATLDTIQTTEKKLFFTKQTFPDLPNYYCKTRWKTNHRERISCYSQKKHKQNEKIMFYSKDGRILKRVDNFTSFNTYNYNYDNRELSSITVEDRSGTLIETIHVTCLKKEKNKNCVILEQHYTVSDSLLRIYRNYNY
ncbi:hypothetical protein FNB79_12520 [Formosa sediminum]|uniref:Lipoprotein n=1 Tax=Formosa sediminum TaxID=2594004 RepID=A0A516GTA5_9FLAO|nr:hypothetical protein [Formosa sediminum]QDO94751.1 hypothetical protein FNB79_12520 [Formosa sediminum]